MIFAIEYSDDETFRHMNLVWGCCNPVWQHKCNCCIPTVGLVCAFHLGSVEELERLYELV